MKTTDKAQEVTGTEKKEKEEKPESTQYKEPLTDAQNTERKDLFQKWKAAEEATAKHEAAAKKAKDHESEVVAKILEKFGKGPFNFEGRELIAVKREDHAYFRGKGKKDVQEI